MPKRRDTAERKEFFDIGPPFGPQRAEGERYTPRI
jgi:hypothetical protein